MRPKAIAFSRDRNYSRNSAVLDIRVVQSTTTAAGAAVWAVRCATANRQLFIPKIVIQFWFAGTGAATEMQYEWIKGTGCTAMSGGSVVTGLIKDVNIANADINARVLDTGLTQTGISQGSAFCNFAWSRLTHSATQAGGISPPFELDFRNDPIVLAPNEVLSLRQAANSVAGDTVGGYVEVYGG